MFDFYWLIIYFDTDLDPDPDHDPDHDNDPDPDPDHDLDHDLDLDHDPDPDHDPDHDLDLDHDHDPDLDPDSDLDNDNDQSQPVLKIAAFILLCFFRKGCKPFCCIYDASTSYNYISLKHLHFVKRTFFKCFIKTTCISYPTGIR